jgi:hypothetical protein
MIDGSGPDVALVLLERGWRQGSGVLDTITATEADREGQGSERREKKDGSRGELHFVQICRQILLENVMGSNQ